MLTVILIFHRFGWLCEADRKLPKRKVVFITMADRRVGYSKAGKAADRRMKVRKPSYTPVYK